MNSLEKWLVAALAGWLLFTAPIDAQTAPDSESGFEIEQLAVGIFAVIRTKSPGMMLDSNIVFIINDTDVVVVDANLSPSSAGRSIVALRHLTDKPVRYLINTHRHADHSSGNATWRKAYPSLEIISQTNMRADLEQFGQATLDGWTGWAQQLASDLPAALASGNSLGGTPLDDELKQSYTDDLKAARELSSDAVRMKIDLPDVAVDTGLVLHRGARSIEIRAPGFGHTRGDLVVWLPLEGILAAGDLVTTPVPLVGADQSYPEQWVETLDLLIALDPQIIVPGHGAVLRSMEPMHSYRDFLAAAVQQTEAAMATGASIEQATDSLDVEVHRARMAGESRILNFLFNNWGRIPTVAALFRVRDETTQSN